MPAAQPRAIESIEPKPVVARTLPPLAWIGPARQLPAAVAVEQTPTVDAPASAPSDPVASLVSEVVASAKPSRRRARASGGDFETWWQEQERAIRAA